MIYHPMKHQQLAYDFCMEHPHAGLFLGMGLGKTVTSLTVLASRIWDDFTVKKCLVIAPKNVAQNVWAQECQKWDHLKDIKCSLILGTEKQRMAALSAPAHLYVINRENVVWLVEALKGRWPFEMVIIDELSSFKSSSAKRWKALKKPLKNTPYVIGLTGTPASNGYLDLWPEVYLLDGGERLGKTITDYRSRYFSMGAHRGHVVYEWRLRLGAQDAINRKLSDLCMSMKSEDWLSLPPVLYNRVYVEMDDKGRKAYETFKNEKVLPLLRSKESTKILDPNDAKQLSEMNALISGDTAATVAGKLLQMANGAVYDSDGTVTEIHDAKLQELAEIIDTSVGCPILLFYAYQHDRDRILKTFPEARVFSGPEDVKDWNEGRIPLLLCHPASTGHGLNLQAGGHIIVWFGLTWSLELYQQANARLQRPGQKERVIIHHIISRGTVDEKVMDALEQKDAGQDSLLEALKQYITEEIK